MTSVSVVEIELKITLQCMGGYKRKTPLLGGASGEIY